MWTILHCLRFGFEDVDSNNILHATVFHWAHTWARHSFVSHMSGEVDNKDIGALNWPVVTDLDDVLGNKEIPSAEVEYGNRQTPDSQQIRTRLPAKQSKMARPS